MTNNPLEHTNRASRRSIIYALVMLAAVAWGVLFSSIGSWRTFQSHEGLAVVPAREMLRTGDFVVPRFAGMLRLKKPPLPYWSIVSSAWLFGDLNEWTARVPAACSAVLLAALVGYWARRWYGDLAGFGAALAQLTSVYVVNYGRKAEIDMFLCLVTTACMYLIVFQPPDETPKLSRRRWMGIYALLSLAWLAKFHYGPSMVLAAYVAHCLVQRQARWLLRLANPIGLLLFAVAVIGWPLLVLRQIPNAWDVWRYETVGRAVGELGHEPLWFYLPYLLMLPLPWTPFALAAIPTSLREAWQGNVKREQFLWVWMVTQLLVVTASATKHSHYLMALLPAVSLLAGRQFAALAMIVRAKRGAISKAHVAWTALAGLIVIAVGCNTVANKWPAVTAPVVVSGLFLCAALVLSLAALIGFRGHKIGLSGFVAGLACYVVVNGWIIPAQDHRRPAARFAAEVREERPDETIHAFGLGERNPFVFYLGAPVRREEALDDVSAALSNDGSILMVAYETKASELSQLADVRPIEKMQVAPHELNPNHPPLVLFELTPRAAKPIFAERQSYATAVR